MQINIFGSSIDWIFLDDVLGPHKCVSVSDFSDFNLP